MINLPRAEGADERFQALLRPDSRFNPVAGGLAFAEGAVWLPADSSLVWSDIRHNRLWRWSEADGASVLRSLARTLSATGAPCGPATCTGPRLGLMPASSRFSSGLPSRGRPGPRRV